MLSISSETPKTAAQGGARQRTPPFAAHAPWDCKRGVIRNLCRRTTSSPSNYRTQPIALGLLCIAGGEASRGPTVSTRAASSHGANHTQRFVILGYDEGGTGHEGPPHAGNRPPVITAFAADSVSNQTLEERHAQAHTNSGTELNQSKELKPEQALIR